MKHKALTAVAHNLANSLASGIGLMIGVYDMDVFGEAARSREGFIEVDFLTGEAHGAAPSPALALAINRYVGAFSDLCEREGLKASDFRKLTARYAGLAPDCQVIVEIEDRNGRTSRDVYVGVPLTRPMTRNASGRIQRLKSERPPSPRTARP